MFDFSLLALLWTTDPLTIQRSKQETVTPMATCVRPAVMVIEPSTVCVSMKSHGADPQAITVWLRRWESATRNTPEWNRSQREDFRRRMHEDFNEHTVAAVEQLVGHVQENSLTENFAWRIVEQNGKQVCLEAIPRDETERLFYGSLRVSLVAGNGALEQLVVVSRNHRLRTVWQAEPRLKDEQIQLVHFENGKVVQVVHFENGIPPAPKALVRTADLNVD